MKKKYQLTFKSVEDLKNFMKNEKDIEFNPPIPVKTLFAYFTETELVIARGAYNAEAEEVLQN
jgi:hypothetical protein